MYNSKIDKKRMDILLPALKNTDRRREKQEPDFILSDLLSVNPIVDKRNSKYKSNTKRIHQSKSGIKFENMKQEQHYRLNRANKLKQNKEYADYLQQNTRENSKTSLKSNIKSLTPSTSEYKNLKFIYELRDTNDQLNEANIQLAEISAFIEEKKREIMKGEKNKTNSELSVNKPKPKPKIMKKKSFPNTSENSIPSKLKLKSNKNSEKLKDVNSMMKFIDNQVAINNRKEKKQIKKIDATLEMVNTKLNKVKEKYFSNDYETSHVDSIIKKRPKYKSVKELLKMTEVRQSTMEGSKLLQSQLEEDINRLTEENQNSPSNHQMEVLYRSVDEIKTDSFQDNFSDDYLLEPKRKEDNNKIVGRYQPKEYFKEGATKFINVRTKAQPALDEDKIMVAVSKTIEADTQTVVPKTLKNSIMKSDYLRKEFGVDTDGRLKSSKAKPGVKPQIKTWSSDLEYFMT